MTAIVNDPASTSAATPGEVPEGKKYDADVIVVGAGPSGSAAAYWLATAGLDVAAAGEDAPSLARRSAATA